MYTADGSGPLHLSRMEIKYYRPVREGDMSRGGKEELMKAAIVTPLNTNHKIMGHMKLRTRVDLVWRGGIRNLRVFVHWRKENVRAVTGWLGAPVSPHDEYDRRPNNINNRSYKKS